MKRAVALAFLVVGCGRPPTPAAAVNMTIKPVEAAATLPMSGPAPLTDARESALQIHLSAGVICARNAGRVYCGAADLPEEAIIQERNAIEGITDALSVGFGQGFTCFLTKEHTVKCSGDNTNGELGAKKREPHLDTFVDVVGLSHVRRLFVGRGHSCASIEDGTVSCWGRNDRGQTGSETHYLAEAHELAGPSVVPNVHSEELAMSFGSTCARTTGGVTCWGAKWDDGSQQAMPNERATTRPGFEGIDSIRGTESGFCGIRSGTIACWGGARRLMPESPGQRQSLKPAILPGIASARDLAVAEDHGCAVLNDGRVSCFGYPYSNALGRAVDEQNPGYEAVAPQIVEGVPRAMAVAVASTASCVLTRESELWCWGRWYTAKGTHDQALPRKFRLR